MQAATGTGNLNYFLATTALAAALLAKPAAAAVPLLIVLLDRGLLQRTWGQVMRAAGPWLALAAADGALTKCLQPGTGLSFTPPLWARPLLAGDTLAFYLWKLAVPWPLAPDYSRTPLWSLAQGWRFYAVSLSPWLLACLLACLPRRRVWLVALGLFVAWLLPVSGLISFDYQRLSTVADRYAYLAMLGPALALAWLLATHWSRWLLLATAAACGGLGVLSALQTSSWRDTAVLFQHCRAVNPASAAAACCLGELEAAAGRHAAAVALFRRSLGEHPEIVELPVALANSLVALGELPEARQTLAEAARRFPESPVVEEDLGHVCERLGATDEAIEHYRRAVQLPPEDPARRLLLGRLLESSGRLTEARFEYETTAKLCPNLAAVHYRLANIAQAENNLPEAIAEYEAAILAAPDYAEAHANLGVALMAAGKIDAAIEHERTVLRLDPRLPPAHFHLARALETQGRRAEAVAEYRRALGPLSPDAPMAREIRRLLERHDDAIKNR